MGLNNYLKKNDRFVNLLICKFYPFTPNKILELKGILNWYALSLNNNINWAEIPEEFLCEYLLNEADIDFINQMQANCTPENNNPDFECIEELHSYFDQKLSWGFKDCKRGKTSNPELVRLYFQYFQQYIKAFISLAENMLPITESHKSSEFNSYLFTKPADIFLRRYQDKYDSSINWDLESIERIEDVIEWNMLSDFKGVQWSTALLSKYNKRFDKSLVLKNPSFPLTNEMIEVLQPSEGELLSADQRIWDDLYCEIVDDAFVDNLFQSFKSLPSLRKF